jgi:CubicO group peptidase (beta-lactamase class C family)
MYAAVLDERVVSAGTAQRHRSERVRGMDLVLLYETRYGLGWQLPTEMTPLGPNDEAFGHGGLGGSLAFADPVAGVAAAYVMNRLVYPVPGETTRAGALVDALYGALR